jgi:hypothetical protein
MAHRAETFYWISAKEMDQETARQVTRLNEDFVRVCQLDGCIVLHHPSNSDQVGAVKRLWLFRFQHPNYDESFDPVFRKRLESNVGEVREKLGRPEKSLQIKTANVTPLLLPPLNEDWPTIDIGLHNAAQPYNANLRAFAYHYGQGGRWMHPALELYQIRRVLRRVESVWRQIACECRDPNCEVCSGGGCTACFKVACPRCSGTGWKGFSNWADSGYRIDYTSGFPIAHPRVTL